jgi:hypothetical protein
MVELQVALSAAGRGRGGVVPVEEVVAVMPSRSTGHLKLLWATAVVDL